MTAGAGIEAGVRRTIIAAIAASPALTDAINGVFEPGAAGMTAPYVLVEAMTARDWGTKDRDGREMIVNLSIHDARREGEGVAGLAALVAAAVLGVARSGDGYAIGSVRLRRSDIARRKNGAWVATIDFRVRALVD